MSRVATIFTNGKIFDGSRLLEKHSAVFSNGVCTSIVADSELDKSVETVELQGDILSVGYTDLQVNGGGGALLNDGPSEDRLNTIVDAHRSLGTTRLLPTLITDTPAVTQLAIEAVKAATSAQSGAIAGLHLEGPHLSVAKKGAHKAELIRPMQPVDLTLLLQAAQDIPVLKITVAPENVTCKQVSTLVEAGVIVALGHSNANYKTCMEYHQAGARCVTHLYNAMSQLSAREPGLVGAALDAADLSVGLIADGVHVHPAAIRTAWKAKACSDKLYLVTDAMALAGTTLSSFSLNGRTIRRQNARLTLEDGTLAGADIDLTSSLRFLCNDVGVELVDALKAAVVTPRKILGMDKTASELLGQSANDVIRISAGLDSVTTVQ